MKYIQLILLIVVLVSCREADEIAPGKMEGSTYNIGVINDEINGTPIVVYANEERNYLAAFSREDNNGIVHEFELSGFPFPDVMKNKGNEIWNVFGEHRGNDDGKDLTSIDQLVGYWFAFPPFHENILFRDGTNLVNPNFDNRKEIREDWLLDRNFIFSGSIKDGIQSIDQPQFIKVTSKEFIDNAFYKSLDPDELLTALKVGNEIRLYPHRILEYHEIVNDEFGDNAVVISFCPLTGTSRAWNRSIGGVVREFGVSGLLYNNNLILYDRVTNSHWSQIFDQSVNGQMIGEKVESMEVFEVKASDAIELPGNTLMLSTNTGIQYDYNYSVYGDYKFSDRISFPLSFSDDRIPSKERVIGVTCKEVTKVYRFSDFNK